MISVVEAEDLVRKFFLRLPDEQVPLDQAVGRILRQTVNAERDQPPFDRVMMDGIALRSADVIAGIREFAVADIQAAGQPARMLTKSGTCIEVMTGAVLPVGSDCVVPVEALEIKQGRAILGPQAAVEAKQYVHPAGSDHRAGTVLLSPGQKLSAPAIAVLASAGCLTVKVAARPRMCVIATGDELVTGNKQPEPHQIRSSNAPAMAAALRLHGWGQAELMHLADDQATLLAGLESALEKNDLLILSGGVSRGRYDFVPEVLTSLGVTTHFHRVRQRPGKPMWFGTRTRDKKVVFGLPGNPVSSLVCLHRFVLPGLHAAAGAIANDMSAVLTEDIASSGTLARFVPVNIQCVAGQFLASPQAVNTSGDFCSLAKTQGFVELPAADKSIVKGSAAKYFAWTP